MSARIPVGERHTCAYASLDDERHFLFGGGDREGSRALASVVEYNSTSQKFREHPRIPPGGRIYSAATAIDDDRLLVVGGYSLKTWDSCLMYDTKSRKWSTDWPSLNARREHHRCVVNDNNKVYVFGGWNFRDGFLDTIEELDLLLPTPSWRVLPQRLDKKLQKHLGYRCAIAHVKNSNNIIVAGGWNNKDKDLRSCEMICLDPTQEGETRTLPFMMTPRKEHALVLVENRFVVAIGGTSTGYQPIASVEFLDLEEEPQEEQQWRPLPSL